MTNKTLFTALTLGGMAMALSCDDGSRATASSLPTDDCVIGMFRPEGLDDCVFPADDQNGSPLGVSDNRCAEGQPAVPPACVNDAGGRAYLAATTTCAPGYRYEPGACDRGGTGGVSTGSAGGTVTVAGTAGTGPDFGGDFTTGAAGATGAAGSSVTGFGTGAAGSVAGESGVGGQTSGAGGDDVLMGDAGATVTAVDAATDAMSID